MYLLMMFSKVYENKAKQLQQTMEKVNKIQLSYDNGHGHSKYRNRIQSLINDFEKYGLSVKEAEEKTQILEMF